MNTSFYVMPRKQPYGCFRQGISLNLGALPLKTLPCGIGLKFRRVFADFNYDSGVY